MRAVDQLLNTAPPASSSKIQPNADQQSILKPTPYKIGSHHGGLTWSEGDHAISDASLVR